MCWVVIVVQAHGYPGKDRRHKSNWCYYNSTAHSTTSASQTLGPEAVGRACRLCCCSAQCQRSRCCYCHSTTHSSTFASWTMGPEAVRRAYQLRCYSARRHRSNWCYYNSTAHITTSAGRTTGPETVGRACQLCYYSARRPALRQPHKYLIELRLVVSGHATHEPLGENKGPQ